jgi:hypothetical protein
MTTSTRDSWFKKFKRYIGQAIAMFTINLLVTAYFHNVHDFPKHTSFALSLGFVFFLNFALLKFFVFENPSRNISKQIGLTFLISVCFRILEYLSFSYIDSQFSANYLVIISLVLCVSFVLKFLFYQRIFRLRDP